MANSTNKKRTKSSAERLAQQNRSGKNKLRRMEKLKKYLASAKCLKRREQREARALAKRHANAANPRYQPGPNQIIHPLVPEITVRLNEGKTYHVLAIEATIDGPRDRTVLPKELRDGALGNLTMPGGITFLTASGKKWHMKFNEFCFAINHNA